jgi:hypothetical protein
MQILDNTAVEQKEITHDDVMLCSHCHEKPAEIFQVIGDYCLDCWQIITHTNA